MTLPQNVKGAVRSIDDSETVAATPHPDCNALVKIISVDDWQTILAHLLSQDAELDDYKNSNLHAADDCVAKDAEIERLQDGLAKHVDRVCELETRLAAANKRLEDAINRVD